MEILNDFSTVRDRRNTPKIFSVKGDQYLLFVVVVVYRQSE